MGDRSPKAASGLVARAGSWVWGAFVLALATGLPRLPAAVAIWLDSAVLATSSFHAAPD
jgi:hypothetical protein